MNTREKLIELLLERIDDTAENNYVSGMSEAALNAAIGELSGIAAAIRAVRELKE